jgi:genome maintenance exonuclease 1
VPKFTHVGFGKGKNTLPILEQLNSSNGRRYKTPKGDLYPSITTVLGLGKEEKLKGWVERVGKEEAERIKFNAASRGTIIHTLAEMYVNNEPRPSWDDERLHVKNYNRDPYLIARMWKQFRPLLDNIDLVHCQEARMYSDTLRVAGTVDCIANYDGTLCIIDYKTSTNYKKAEWISDYFMQATAYSIMYEEMTGIQIENLKILIALESNPDPLVFSEKRSKWLLPLLNARKKYDEYVDKTVDLV